MADPAHPTHPERDLAHHRLAVKGRVGELDILFDASFSARWTVLFGPSGCGKSTILRAACGLLDHLAINLQRRSGQQWTILHNATSKTPPEHRKITYAPQHAVLFPHLTVQQNVSFADVVRARQPSGQSLVRESMALFQLEPLASRLPRHLSGGERQRVSLARAFAVPDARLVLLDEPFAGLDRSLRDRLLPRMQAWLGSRRLSVISVTHDVDEALLLDAEVIRLRDGTLLAQGPATEVLADEASHMLQALQKPPMRDQR